MDDNRPTFLCHYASKYYDPVAAHEYYEEHKKLKARKSTSGLNETGLAAATYVKKNIDEETSTARQSLNDNYSRDAEAAQERHLASLESRKAAKDEAIAQHAKEMKSKIDLLKGRLERMTPQQRAHLKNSIAFEIENLRLDNNAARAKLNEEYGTDRAKLIENYKSEAALRKEQLNADSKKLSEEQEEKYLSELDAIKADPNNLAETTSKNGSSGSSSGNRAKAMARKVINKSPTDNSQAYVNYLAKRKKELGR